MTAVEAGLLLGALLLAGIVGISRLGYEEFAVVRSGLVLRFYDNPVLHKSLFAVFADLVMVGMAVYGALVLRFEDLSLRLHHDDAILMFAVLAPFTAASFWIFGLYRGSWRLASINDFDRLCIAVATSTFAAFLAYQIVARHAGSLSVFVIYALIKLVLANGSRASYRVLATKGWRAASRGTPVVIYGAGVGGAAALRELLSNAALEMRPIGFLDDDSTRTGRSVNGYPIVGGVEALDRLVEKIDISAVIVASAKITPARLRAAQDACNRLGIRLLRMRVTFGTCEVAPTENPETIAAQLLAVSSSSSATQPRRTSAAAS